METLTRKIDLLINETIRDIQITLDSDDNTCVLFLMESNKKVLMTHFQNCCENVSLIEGQEDLLNLKGQKIIDATEVVKRYDSDIPQEAYYLGRPAESLTWTFYHITSQNFGTITLRWYGESNGYYSETVDIIEVTD